MQSYIDTHKETEVNEKVINNLITSTNTESTTAAQEDERVSEFLDKYIAFQEVRNGLLGKTAQFWMFFLDNSQLVFLLIYVVKINNLFLFHTAMGDMADLFFIWKTEL